MRAEVTSPASTLDTMVKAVSREESLDRLADPLQDYIRKLFRSRRSSVRWIKDSLHGTLLGHSLHPAVTDVPIGAWTAAVAIDAVEVLTGRDFGACSTASIGLGLAGGVGAMASGAADWSETYGEERRIGIAHALGNATAMALFGLSLLQRLRGKRAQGMALSLAGYGVAAASAYLGGDLVLRQGTGVNRTAWFQAPAQFTAVMAAADLPENEPRRVQAGRARIVLVRKNGNIYALDESCAHAGGPLAKGKVEDGLITCPWHGSQYRLDTGQVVHGPSAYSQPCLEVRVEGGQIEVRRAARH